MSTHDMAILTYEELKKRRAAKRKIQERMIAEVHFVLTARCAKLGNQHKSRGAVKANYIAY